MCWFVIDASAETKTQTISTVGRKTKQQTQQQLQERRQVGTLGTATQ